MSLSKIEEENVSEWREAKSHVSTERKDVISVILTP
jgi:hypothetical protein